MNVVPSDRRHPRVVLSTVALVVAGLAVSACTGDDDTPSPTTTPSPTSTTTIAPNEEDGVLTLGVYLPRTGEGSALGEPMIEAVRNAVAAVNEAGGVFGHDVATELLDEGAGAGPGELMTRGVDAVIGPASSTDALLQLDELVGSNGVVVCSPSATALALDDYPDNSLFFRTVPSDSLQMVAIHRAAQDTGASTIAVSYLDDPYGRGLADRLLSEIDQNRPPALVGEVPFGADQEDLSDSVERLLAEDPGAVVILGDVDDGGRMLAAVGTALADDPSPPPILVNDSIRTARTTIEGLPDPVRRRLVVVAPVSAPIDGSEPSAPFAANAAYCVDLIALAATQIGSDSPMRIRTVLNSVSSGGRSCESFSACAERLEPDILIDYDPPGSVLELSNNGDPAVGLFESVGFKSDGTEARDDRTVFTVP